MVFFTVCFVRLSTATRLNGKYDERARSESFPRKTVGRDAFLCGSPRRARRYRVRETAEINDVPVIGEIGRNYSANVSKGVNIRGGPGFVGATGAPADWGGGGGGNRPFAVVKYLFIFKLSGDPPSSSSPSARTAPALARSSFACRTLAGFSSRVHPAEGLICRPEMVPVHRLAEGQREYKKRARLIYGRLSARESKTGQPRERHGPYSRERSGCGVWKSVARLHPRGFHPGQVDSPECRRRRWRNDFPPGKFHVVRVKWTLKRIEIEYSKKLIGSQNVFNNHK